MRFIDTHVHIDFFDNFEEILIEYEKKEIYALFVTMLPEIFEKHIIKMESYRFVRLALGFHPQVSLEYNFNFELFKKYITHTNYIGEIGIDASLDLKHILDKQLNVFDTITQPQYSKGKVLSIHSKRSEEDILSILQKNKVKNAIFHWYTGSLKTLEDLCTAGYYFSINPKMAQTDKGKKIIMTIPQNRLLFETDAPFAKVNRKIITPQLIPSMYKSIEDLCKITEFKNTVFNNFKTLLNAAESERISNLPFKLIK